MGGKNKIGWQRAKVEIAPDTIPWLGDRGEFGDRHTTGNEITSQVQKANGPLVGGKYYFDISNIRLVPEPSTSVLVLIALGTLGTGLTLQGSVHKLHTPSTGG